MKNFIITTVFILIGSFQIFGQEPNSNENIMTPKGIQDTTNPNQLFFLINESFPLNTKEKVYLNKEFSKGIIFDFEDNSHEVSIRYRVSDDEMQIQHLDKIKALVPQRINKVILKNNDVDQIFIPSAYIEKKVEHLGFFELLSKGKISLLIGYRSTGKTSMDKVYFYKKDDAPARCFSKKKSKFLKIFGNKKSEVAKYMVSNKLNQKNEKHLKKIFSYYNSL